MNKNTEAFIKTSSFMLH